MFGLDQRLVLVIVFIILFILFFNKIKNNKTKNNKTKEKFIVDDNGKPLSINKNNFYFNKIKITRDNTNQKLKKPINLGLIQIFNSCNQNIAPNKKVIASSIHPKYGTENLTNGKKGTFAHTGDKPLDIEFFEIEINSFVSKIILNNRQDCCQDRAQGLIINLSGYTIFENGCNSEISPIEIQFILGDIKNQYILLENGSFNIK